MNLFGADAFSPQAIMNASSILDGGDPMQQDPKKRKSQFDNQSPLAGIIQSLFHHGSGGQLDPQSMQALYGPSLMSYFGG